jgi:hypothetical protein
MHAAIEIPTPTATDSESVVTALETAAVFQAKGDMPEAIRWLQRAAESAGDAGDDERTLSLARTAAELSRAIASNASNSQPPAASSPSQPRGLPKPPPRVSSLRPPAEDDSAATPSRRPEPGRSVPAPQPPSHRPLPPSTTRSQPSSPTRPSVTPEASTPSRPAASSLRPSLNPPEKPRSSVTPPPPAVDATTKPSTGLTPRLRPTARVSVVPSPDEAGLFLVRVLDDQQPAASGSEEGLLVLVDPSSKLFAG